MGFIEDCIAARRADLKSLTNEQRYAVIYAMEEAANIRGGFNSADISHSSLLWRLLTGEPPLEKVPPKSFSYPNYELAEGKEETILEIWKDKFSESNDIWYIDQSCWYSEDGKIFKWPASGELYQLTDYGDRKTLKKIS